jgi:hypothetical protein
MYYNNIIKGYIMDLKDLSKIKFVQLCKNTFKMNYPKE